MCSGATAPAASVRPDGAIMTKMVELPRSEWAVVIQDHHEGYISWEQFLANEQRLAANNTRKGPAPAARGRARSARGSCAAGRAAAR